MIPKIPDTIVDQTGTLTDTAKKWFFNLFTQVNLSASTTDTITAPDPTSGNILIGDGTDFISHPVTGDISLDSLGGVTVTKIQSVSIDPTHATAVSNLSGVNTGDQTNISGNAGTVTNGVYTTDVGTVTNAMLAGSIANSQLANTAVANLSGTNTGDQTNITGNAATVTTNANLTGPVTSTGNATAIANNALSIAKTSGLQSALDAKLPLAGGTMTGNIILPNIAPTNSLHATAKGYVDATRSATIVTDLYSELAIIVSVGAANYTYNNGSSGSGATLIRNQNGLHFSALDGVTISSGTKALLVTSSQPANGIYICNDPGTASTPATWTRSTLYDTPILINSTGFVAVLGGTVNAGKDFALLGTVTTIGTDNLPYVPRPRVIAESSISFTDITTNNASTSVHGYLKKLSNVVTEFMNGQGAWSVPPVTTDATLTSTDITTNNVTSSKHGFTPKSPADATKFLNGADTPAYAQVKDSDLSTTDITTNNVSTSKHGFAPKGSGSTQIFLNANGAYSSPLTIVKQSFTAGGTYTPTTGMVYCVIEAIGAGGGGGGAATTTSIASSGAGGGGAGGYSRILATAATIGASQTVTIGSAGSAGSAGNNAGGNGGDTSVGTICIAKGGSGGSGSGSSQSGAGGAGGISGTGDMATVGPRGNNGFGHSSNGTIGCYGGLGGNNIYGSGGAGGQNGTAGSTASIYGSGGGGGTTNASTQTAGGAGSAGFVIVTEYIIG